MPRNLIAKFMRAGGFVLAYGALAAFIGLIAYQAYRWLHDGQWTPIGVDQGLRVLLRASGIKDGDSGRLASFMRWLAAPTNWLGWHKVLEVIPASIGMFVLSVFGNWVHLYGADLLEQAKEKS